MSTSGGFFASSAAALSNLPINEVSGQYAPSYVVLHIVVPDQLLFKSSGMPFLLINICHHVSVFSVTSVASVPPEKYHAAKPSGMQPSKVE